MITAFALTAALLAPAGHHDPTPHQKHDDTGCCASFDNSPVQLVFCTTKDACTITPPAKP